MTAPLDPYIGVQLSRYTLDRSFNQYGVTRTRDAVHFPSRMQVW